MMPMEQEGFGAVPADAAAAIAADPAARQYRFGQIVDGVTTGVGRVSARFESFLPMLDACRAEMGCRGARFFKPCWDIWHGASSVHRRAHPDQWPTIDSLPDF